MYVISLRSPPCREGHLICCQLITAGPLPTFDKGPPPPAIQPQLTGQRALPPLSTHNTGSGPGLPTLMPADRAKFTRLFANAGPSNGLVSGDKARDMFLKSGLSYDKLGQIW